MANIRLNQNKSEIFFMLEKKSQQKLNKKNENPHPDARIRNYSNLLIVPDNLEPHIIALMDKGLS